MVHEIQVLERTKTLQEEEKPSYNVLRMQRKERTEDDVQRLYGGGYNEEGSFSVWSPGGRETRIPNKHGAVAEFLRSDAHTKLSNDDPRPERNILTKDNVSHLKKDTNSIRGWMTEQPVYTYLEAPDRTVYKISNAQSAIRDFVDSEYNRDYGEGLLKYQDLNNLKSGHCNTTKGGWKVLEGQGSSSHGAPEDLSFREGEDVNAWFARQ